MSSKIQAEFLEKAVAHAEQRLFTLQKRHEEVTLLQARLERSDEENYQSKADVTIK